MYPVKTLALTLFAAIVAFGLSISSARAVVILQTDGSGHLTGAKNVTVAGLGDFDVEFVDGTCADVFSGCDSPALDFEFQSQADALDAADALLSFVFQGVFDTDPGLIVGCIGAGECSALVPYATTSAQVLSGQARNLGGALTDEIHAAAANKTDDLSVSPTLVFAVFSPARGDVPEPTSLLLFAAGLVGFAGFRLRRQ